MFLLIRPSLHCVLLGIVVAVPALKTAPDATRTSLSNHLENQSAAKNGKLSLPFSQVGYFAEKPQGNFGGAKDLPTTSSSSVLKQHFGNMRKNIQTASRKKIVLNGQIHTKLYLNFSPWSSRLTKIDSSASRTFFLDTLNAKRKSSGAQSLYQSNRGKRDTVDFSTLSKTGTFQSSPKRENVLDISRAAGDRTGITGESCISDSECLGERLCTDMQAGDICSGGSSCRCWPPTLETCTSSSDCETAGEVCTVGATASVCLSESVAVEVDASIVDVDPSEDGDGDGTGLTGEPCTSGSDCLDERLCFDGETLDLCRGAGSCFCRTPALETCRSSSDCETAGEVCIVGQDALVCFSESLAVENDFIIVNVDPSEDEDGDGTGMTGESCTSSSDCLGERLCLDTETEGLCKRGSSCNCRIVKLQTCRSSSDCVTTGEKCVVTPDGLLCMAETAAQENGLPIVDDDSQEGESLNASLGGDEGEDESDDGNSGGSENDEGNGGGGNTGPGGDESEVGSEGSGGEGAPNEVEEMCIDARALEDVLLEDLVFKKHAIRRVLCDENGSCATSGHMVTFHGKAMRMRTYCDVVGCKTATMAVNSARYNRGLRIQSKTEGLVYTAFAARYNTRAEEMVIRMAVGLGL